ncbi:hypothetical protein B0A55_00251 [Friedmanniomyces simplex]|uniref:Uncharacterized protein n=1 Tax=Friedmanniomyces simplex TaxID=329884 RepID=A0A4U0Y0S1_9PEZI|nr:hypothetical protein B0A55_00251 [Friedmanniomyces simplex]
MAAANLEEIKKKYNFKQISVATWRNPNGSILPARGGLKSPVISAEAAGQPFIPSYRVSYKLPEPTDDEDSEGEEDGQSESEDPIDSPLEGPAGEELSEQPEDANDVLDGGNADEIVEVIDESSTGIPYPAVDGEEIVAAVDSLPSTDVAEPPETALAPALEAADGGDVTAVWEDDEAGQDRPWPEQGVGNTVAASELEEMPPPPAPSPPPAEPFDIGPAADDGVDITSDIPGSFPLTVEATPEPETTGLTEPEVVDAPADVPPSLPRDRSVHFAPGTPEPKPTSRKKKGAKGAKQKSKKRVSVPIDSLPDDIVAVVDEAVGEVPPPVPDAPVDDRIDEVVPPDPEAIHEEPLKAAGAEDMKPTELAPSDGGDLPDIVPDLDILPPATAEVVETSKPKKQSSEATSHDKYKDKSKKTSSKSKVKDMIQSFEGHGTDVPPPVPDLNDLLRDIAPPPPPPMVELDDVESFPAPSRTIDNDPDPGDLESSPAIPMEAAPAEDAHSSLEDTSIPISETDIADLPADGEKLVELGAPDYETGVLVHAASPPEIGSQAHSIHEPSVEGEAVDGEHADHELVDLEDIEGDTEAALDPPIAPVEPDTEDQYEEEPPELHGDEPAVEDRELDEVAALIFEEEQHLSDISSEEEEESETRQEDEDSSVMSEVGEDIQTPGDPFTETVDTVQPSSREEARANGETAADVEALDTAQSAITEPAASEPVDDEPPVDSLADDGTGPENETANEPASEAHGSDQDAVAADDLPDSPNAAEEPSVAAPATDGNITEDAVAEPTPEEAQTENASIDHDSAGATATEELVDIPQVDASTAETENGNLVADPGMVDPLPLEAATEAVGSEAAPEEPREALPIVDDLPQSSDEPAALDGPPADPIFDAVEIVEEPKSDPVFDVQDEPPLTSPVAPPSPTLSKGGSHKHRADHWERKHDAKRVSVEAKAEKASSSKRSSRHSKEEPRSADRPHRSRRHSMPAEDEAERRRRREARKAEEIARIIEEERRKAEDEELRGIRHEARRAARKAAAEETARIAKEEAEAVARQEAEARRRRHEEREKGRETTRPHRARRESVTKAPLFFRTSSDQPHERRREDISARSPRYSDRPASKRSSSPAAATTKPRDEEPPAGRSIARRPTVTGPGPVGGRVGDTAEGQ